MKSPSDDMRFYRITLKLCSPLITPLKGDTIWGHIMWGIANHEGDCAVANFLEREQAGEPSLVVSSAFPTGMICKPLAAPVKRTASMTPEQYEELKQTQKIKYVQAADFFQVTPVEDDGLRGFKSVGVVHNAIDRKSMTIQEGGLYGVAEHWPCIQEGDQYKFLANWDIYILSSLPSQRIETLIAWAFENGYGADISTGNGNIQILSAPEPVMPKTSHPGSRRRMALSPFVQNPVHPVEDLRADIFVRTGRIGGTFVSSLVPYKKPVVLYDEGAVFTGDRFYTGRLLSNIHQDPRICQTAFAPALPIGD